MRTFFGQGREQFFGISCRRPLWTAPKTVIVSKICNTNVAFFVVFLDNVGYKIIFAF